MSDLQTALGGILEGMPLDQSEASQRIRRAARALKSPEVKANEFLPGDRVAHKIFGEGTVLQVTEYKGEVSAEVIFEKCGKRTLDLSFANLRRM